MQFIPRSAVRMIAIVLWICLCNFGVLLVKFEIFAASQCQNWSKTLPQWFSLSYYPARAQQRTRTVHPVTSRLAPGCEYTSVAMRASQGQCWASVFWPPSTRPLIELAISASAVPRTNATTAKITLFRNIFGQLE